MAIHAESLDLEGKIPNAPGVSSKPLIITIIKKLQLVMSII